MLTTEQAPITVNDACLARALCQSFSRHFRQYRVRGKGRETGPVPGTVTTSRGSRATQHPLRDVAPRAVGPSSSRAF